jgi:hypothetical protein
MPRRSAARQDGPVEAADLIWNRAALERGGAAPGVADRALADVLAFHGLVMSCGVLDALEQVPAVSVPMS